MIHLSDYTFKYCCASGALGYDGNGYWWEQPWRWLGLLRPQEMLIITKTLTFASCVGNLKWWCPWRCVRVCGNYTVNAVGLSNPGYLWWLEHVELPYPTVVSIASGHGDELRTMISDINKKKKRNLVGIEINISCPNAVVCDFVEDISSELPIILKLSYAQPYLDICHKLDGKVAAFDLINSVPFDTIFPEKRSPLYPLTGGVSGKAIIPYARKALTDVKNAGINTPVISGGGIANVSEVERRLALGADAISFGEVFLRNPATPNRIIHDYNNER